MKTHELKTWTVYFEAVDDGRKPFEVRRDDGRNFETGDLLLLREYDVRTETYTGRECVRVITYRLNLSVFLGVSDGYCVLGLAIPSDSP